jgi:DNA-binding transcriptional regulator YiaG
MGPPDPTLLTQPTTTDHEWRHMHLRNDYAEDLGKLVSKKQAARSVILPPPAERRASRVRAGLTQVDVADVMFVHPSTVGRWERGDKEPGLGARKAYAGVLDTLDALVKKHVSQWPGPNRTASVPGRGQP